MAAIPPIPPIATGTADRDVRTALLLDPRFCEHAGEPGHPESPDRIARLLPLLGDPGRPGLVAVEPRPATRDEILAVHGTAHLERVAATEGFPRTLFDADTSAGAQSYRTALLAAGGVIEVLDAVREGRADNGFALVRPPGHHAERDRVMGFCLFNNVAVGAAHLRRNGIARVAILDWDVHHGNGTQHIFEEDGSVFYASLHLYPFYPGTGDPRECGTGAGAGATLNVPMRMGDGDLEFLAAIDERVIPALRRFRPEFLLVSAGFDAHGRDPLGGANVSTACFAEMTRRVMRTAGELCGDRLVLVLEGGYDLHALDECVRAVWRELGRREEP
jgi:acetoin utilization deacetylase AcuC-like enzyme